MRTEDGAIIHKCLNGDREAFAFLIDKYKSAIYAYVRAKIGNIDDAEDVTQEVFIKAFKDLPKLRRWDSFTHWLYAIAACRCRNWKRAKSRRPDNEYIEDQEPAKLEKLMSEPAIESYQNKELDESLHEALNKLPEIYREVLMLYYMGGMNSEQIAHALMKTPESIRQRLSRARALLKEELVAMMSTALPKQRLQASFTFRIVEAIKKIKINPFSDIKGLPWGLSIATGIIIAVMSLGSNLPKIIELGNVSGFPLPIESQISKVGEIPVSLMKISDSTIISNHKKKADNGESKKPDENAFFMAPQGEGNTIVKKADMHTERCFFAACVVNDKIYALGGVGQNTVVLSSVEEYDPTTDTWTMKEDMPAPRYGFATSVINGKIYAFGGANLNNNAPLSSVDEYDPEEDKWTKKTDMAIARCLLATSVVGGKIYAIGGQSILGVNSVPTVEEYTPEGWPFASKSVSPQRKMPKTWAMIKAK